MPESQLRLPIIHDQLEIDQPENRTANTSEFTHAELVEASEPYFGNLYPAAKTIGEVVIAKRAEAIVGVETIQADVAEPWFEDLLLDTTNSDPEVVARRDELANSRNED